MHCKSRREGLASCPCLQGPTAKCACAHWGLWDWPLWTTWAMLTILLAFSKGINVFICFHVAVLHLPLVCSAALRCPVLPIFTEHVTQKRIGLFNGHLLQWLWTVGIKNCHVFCTNIAATDPCSCKHRTRQRLPSFQGELQNFQSRLHLHIRLARGSQWKIFESWTMIIVLIPEQVTRTKHFLKPFPTRSRSSGVASCQNFTNMDQGSGPSP